MGPTAAEEERLGNPKKVLNLAPFLLIELGMEIFCTAKPSEVCQAIWQCINQADFHYTKEYLRKHTPGQIASGSQMIPIYLHWAVG